MNNILFLGTGAADWEIENREENSFFRRNSSALINGKILIDPNAHIFDYLEKSENPALFDKVKYILVTHNHSDHVNANSVKRLAKDKQITAICPTTAQNRIGECENLTYITPEFFSELNFGEYSILPLPANHDDVFNAFHYIIKTPDSKELFYGLDGAWFLRPSWEEMKKHKFDMAVLDCTVGDFDDWRLFEHNTVPMLRKMVAEMKRLEMVKGTTVASHLARTLHPSHEECEKLFLTLGMVTAYDGMSLEF